MNKLLTIVREKGVCLKIPCLVYTSLNNEAHRKSGEGHCQTRAWLWYLYLYWLWFFVFNIFVLVFFFTTDFWIHLSVCVCVYIWSWRRVVLTRQPGAKEALLIKQRRPHIYGLDLKDLKQGQFSNGNVLVGNKWGTTVYGPESSWKFWILICSFFQNSLLDFFYCFGKKIAFILWAKM